MKSKSPSAARQVESSDARSPAERQVDLVGAAARWVAENTPVDDQKRKAYAEHEKYEAMRWQQPSTISVTGDAWTDAVLAWAECNEIEPLTQYLKAVGKQTAPAFTPQQLHNLAGIVEILHSRGKKRLPGKPRGLWQRWQDANYIAAWIAEQRILCWKREHDGRSIPIEDRNAIVEQTVLEVREWHVAKRKKPNSDRVSEILRGPKDRRLAIPHFVAAKRR
jgi:hypothetical protein